MDGINNAKAGGDRGKLKVAGVMVLAMLAFGGIGYSVYAWSQNQQQQSTINDKSAQIDSLNKEVESLQATITDLKEKESAQSTEVTDKDAAQAAAQLYLDAQVLDAKYVATVHQIEGDFASAGVTPADRPDYGLSSILLKKVSGTWVVVFQGAQQPEKQIGDRFGLPKDWYQEQ